jgi:hypothetical protein
MRGALADYPAHRNGCGTCADIGSLLCQGVQLVELADHPGVLLGQFALAVGILEALARAGDAQAREALYMYVGDGERWIDALQTIAYQWPVERWDDLWEIAAARLSTRIQLSCYPMVNRGGAGAAATRGSTPT